MYNPFQENFTVKISVIFTDETGFDFSVDMTANDIRDAGYRLPLEYGRAAFDKEVSDLFGAEHLHKIRSFRAEIY